MSENKFEINSQEEVAFKLFNEIENALGQEVYHPMQQGMISRKANTKEIREQKLKLFALILSIVKGETKEKDIKLPDLIW